MTEDIRVRTNDVVSGVTRGAGARTRWVKRGDSQLSGKLDHQTSNQYWQKNIKIVTDENKS